MRPKECLCRINKELSAIFVSDFLNKELIRIIQHCIHTAALTAYLPQAQDNVHSTLTPVTRVRQLSILTTQRRLLHTVDLPAPETGQTPSTGLRHPFFFLGGGCRKAMLEVWILECYRSVKLAGAEAFFSGFLPQKNR